MAANPKFMNKKVTKFTLNGKKIEAFGEETILEAAKRQGIEIPHLCYKEGYRPDGNCVITSYSIHYTKLYDDCTTQWIWRGLSQTTNGGIFHGPGQLFQQALIPFFFLHQVDCLCCADPARSALSTGFIFKETHRIQGYVPDTVFI